MGMPIVFVQTLLASLISVFGLEDGLFHGSRTRHRRIHGHA